MKKILSILMIATLLVSVMTNTVSAAVITSDTSAFSWSSVWDSFWDWITNGSSSENSDTDINTNTDTGVDIGVDTSSDTNTDTSTDITVPDNTEKAFKTEKDIYIVTSSLLNVREAMSNSANISMILKSGDLVTLNQKNGTWLNISYDVQSGWADSAFLKQVNTATVNDKAFVFAGEYKVTSSYLYIREKPDSNADYNLYVQKGTVVNVYDACGDWYYVGYNGNYGWASAEYLNFVTATNDTLTFISDSKTSGKYKVTGSKLTVRLRNSSVSDVVGSVVQDETVIVYRIEGDWAYINYNNLVGWVNASYLKKVESDNSKNEQKSIDKYIVTANKLNVRDAASTNSKVIGSISNGAVVSLNSQNGSWSNITYNDITGWVSSSYISFLYSTVTGNGNYQASSKGGGKIFAKGIDISKWNDKIDWETLVKSGVEYVIIRMGYSGKKDPAFETNYANAKAAGLNVGAYIYSYANTLSEAVTDAQDCIAWAKGKTFEYPIYFDIEDDVQKKLTKDLNTEMCLSFCQILKDNGYLGGIYTGHSFISYYLNKTEIMKNCEVWIARYYNGTYKDGFGYSTTYGMWQYTEEGSLKGINGNVDMNVCYKDYPTIMKTNGFNGYSTLDTSKVVSFERASLKDVSGGQNILKILDQFGENVIVIDRNGNATNSYTGITSGYKLNIYENGVIKSVITVILNGDFNLDGTIKMDDITSLQRYIAGLSDEEGLLDYQEETGDVNCDGDVNMQDVVMIQQFIAGLIDCFN